MTCSAEHQTSYKIFGQNQRQIFDCQRLKNSLCMYLVVMTFLGMKYVQFSSISSLVLRGKVSERPAWKDESWALLETDCDWWVPDNWSCSEEAPPSASLVVMVHGMKRSTEHRPDAKIRQWWTIYLADSRLQHFHDLHLPHSPLSLYSRSLSPPLLIPSLKRKSHKYNRGFGEHCELFNSIRTMRKKFQEI